MHGRAVEADADARDLQEFEDRRRVDRVVVQVRIGHRARVERRAPLHPRLHDEVGAVPRSESAHRLDHVEVAPELPHETAGQRPTAPLLTSVRGPERRRTEAVAVGQHDHDRLVSRAPQPAPDLARIDEARGFHFWESDRPRLLLDLPLRAIAWPDEILLPEELEGELRPVLTIETDEIG